MPNTPQRLPVFQRYEPPLYFVTFNTHRRTRLLANEAVHTAFIEFAQNGEDRGVGVGRYVLMPDHVHLFVQGNIEFVLNQWVRLLKRRLSKAIGRPSPHWQEGFFDHIIRHSESYAGKWEYVSANPVRAGLVVHPDDWPWQGEIMPLEARSL
jgi:putative transposase